ncbi:hypothetical protein F2Q70_00018537 [Brassica cretica]|uniref:Uncharacterized protein n=1 Tax=Brassica cretica TaxID=69181 RepID=A0A8S9I2M8_BRACR|nr:hypothetical protein F2Q70_00018537 [Brassica cretica]
MDDPMDVDPPLPEQSQETLAYAGVTTRKHAEFRRRFIQREGVPAELTSVYSFLQKPPSLIYSYAPQPNRHRIRSVQPIATLQEALYHLRSHPIGADLIAYSQLFEMGNDIYYGPRAGGAEYLEYHAVIVESVMLYRGEYVAYCRMSNGVQAGDGGYVSDNTRTSTSPHQFCFLDMWKPEDLASRSTGSGDTQVPTNKQEEMTGTPLCEEMPESHNLDARDQQNPQEQIQSDAHQFVPGGTPEDAE